MTSYLLPGAILSLFREVRPADPAWSRQNRFIGDIRTEGAPHSR